MKFTTFPFLISFLLCLESCLLPIMAFENTDNPRKIELSRGEIGRPSEIPTFELKHIPLIEEGSKHTLHTLNGEPVLLSETWKDKPVLLVMSSLTCPVSRDNCPAVDRIQKKYGDKINVVIIYTTEAHPLGSPSPYSDREWLTRRNVHDEILVNEPTTLKARIVRAKTYQEKMGIQSTILVDNMQNSTWKLFGGGPNTALFVSNDRLLIKSKDESKKRPELLERHGWLSPHGMEIAIHNHFNKIRNAKLRNSIKKDGYSDWDFDKFLLSDNFDAIEAKLDKHPDLVQYSVSHDRGGYQQKTFLHLAVEKKSTQHIELFIKRGLDIDAINYRGQTALHVAATSDLKIVELLLKRGANVNAYQQNGFTPLHEALLEGKLKIANILIAHGSRVDLKAAAALGDERTVARFLNLYEIDTFKLKNRGGTALAFAASNGQTTIVKQLLDAGALVNSKTDDMRPLYYAVKIDHPKIIELLLESKANTTDPIGSSYNGLTLMHYATLHNKKNALELLLKHGISPEVLNYDEETPLHLAAQYNHLEAMKILLKYGASIDALSGSPRFPPCGPPDFDESPVLETAMHLAVKHGHTTMLQFLLKQGAKANLKNRDGATPLDLARKYKKTDMVKILLAVNAEPGKPVKSKIKKFSQ
ncbi:Phosphocholine transferase AnkX [Gimesia alba]|uniref:Phosphocholine transferase AnkX n=1 Tax=Gimesia alba TaxID=2527973 RepID=A0A517RJJ5_9PLAN|nr:ankyrin repeat domain-containing protein [Gimesia alba]QDT44054.1 Phosphocholine transferase AnkX [Gimesia alba]